MANVEVYVKIVRTEENVRILVDDMMNKLAKNPVWRSRPLPSGFKVSPIKVRSVAANDDMRDVYVMTEKEYNRWCHGMTYIPIISWDDLGEPRPFRTVDGEPIEFHSGWPTCNMDDEIDGILWNTLCRQGYTNSEGMTEESVKLVPARDCGRTAKMFCDVKDQKIPLSKELKAQIRNLAKSKPVLCKCVAEEFWRVLDGTEDWVYKPSGTKIGDVVDASITGNGFQATINLSDTRDYTNYGGFVKMTPEDLEDNYIKEDEKVKEDIKKAINSVYGAGTMYGTPTKNGRVYVQRPVNSLKVIEKVIINGDTTIVFFKTNFFPYPAKIVISRQNIEGKNEPRLSLEDRILLACVKRHRDNKRWKYLCDTVDLWTTTVDYIAKNNIPAAYLADYRHDINYIFNRLPKKNKVLIIQKEPEV